MLHGAQAVAAEAISCVRTIASFAKEPVHAAMFASKVEACVARPPRAMPHLAGPCMPAVARRQAPRGCRYYKLNVKQVFLQAVYYMAISTFLINTVGRAPALPLPVAVAPCDLRARAALALVWR